MRYWYKGIPRKVAVAQIEGERFGYNPDAGTYNTDTEHPELEKYLYDTTSDSAGRAVRPTAKPAAKPAAKPTAKPAAKAKKRTR